MIGLKCNAGQKLPLLITVFLVLSFCGALASAELEMPVISDPFEWEKVVAVPLETEVEGAFIGLSNENIILAGGRERGAQKEPGFSSGIFFFDTRDEAPVWKEANVALPVGTGFGVTVSTADGVICVGGLNAQGPTKSVIRLVFNRERNTVESSSLVSLPEPLDGLAAAAHDEILYVIGFVRDSSPAGGKANRFWSLELDESGEAEVWAPLQVPEDDMEGVVAMIPQYDGMETSLYVFGETGEGIRFSLKDHTWHPLTEFPQAAIHLSAGVPVGTATVFLTADNVSGDQNFFSIYNTITDRWAVSSRLPLDSPPLTLISREQSVFAPVLDGGGVTIYRGDQKRLEMALSMLDYIVLAGYFGLLIAMGFFFSRREKSTLNYFKAGKRIPGWAMGISLMVTSTSAISFISLPAKAFVTDWLWFATNLFAFVGALLVFFFFLPFFARLDVTTAYEYLERRFNVRIRLLGGALFLVSEIFRMGALSYMPALALSVVTGLDIYLCILLIGVVATVYTLMGGIEAVIWTDVLQTFIMIAGLFCMIGIVFYRLDAGVFESLGTAWDLQKFRTFDFSFDFTIVTVWVVLTTLPVGANTYITNQALFQRLVTTPNLRETGKGLIIKSIVGPFIILLLFLTGTCIFLFYYYSPGQFNPALSKPDQILPWFIVVELPAGVSGLMIGAIFAASMSSLDSGINSICTVCVNDIYGRFAGKYDDLKALRMAKIITVLMGILGTFIAILIASAGIKTMIDVYYQYVIIFMGCIGGIYMLGFFTTRGNSMGAVVGFLAASGVLIYVKFQTGLIFFTYGLIATSVGLIVGYFASLVWKGEKKPMDGLTFYT